ncbi:uncharacterized protein [Paramisgurnus dabryanus]|uniref:uncharacterized protein isoform X2 n=1 Tax=Paramisgurnus dabryanus TaxID=90735 RepID=UPI003CCF3569
MKTVLKWIVWPLILVIPFLEGTFSHHYPVTVLVNQRLTLNASSCENGEWIKVIPTQATIAKCKKHTCEIEKAYQKKYELEDTSNNLVIKSTKYNDKGTYDFNCNGEKYVYILDVLVPHNMTAQPLSNFTLMCYVTNAKDVKWMHKETVVFYHAKNGTTSIDEGFKDRGSLNKGCFEDGNCSLTVFYVREVDAGLYRCFSDDESEKGDPHAYMLFVKEEHSSPEGNCTEFNVWWWITNLGLAVALFIVSFLYITSKAANQSTSNDYMLTNITEPVQESDNNLKSSSTVTTF